MSRVSKKICTIKKRINLYLEFVETQTEEICLEAVKQNGSALQFVKEQTNVCRIYET
jgi:hypothetical protein